MIYVGCVLGLLSWQNVVRPFCLTGILAVDTSIYDMAYAARELEGWGLNDVSDGEHLRPPSRRRRWAVGRVTHSRCCCV